MPPSCSAPDEVTAASEDIQQEADGTEMEFRSAESFFGEGDGAYIKVCQQRE